MGDAVAKSEKKLLSVRVLCPTSGLAFDGMKIEPHYMMVFTTRKALSLYIRCDIHNTTGFINSAMLVERILKNGTAKDSKPAAHVR